MNKIGNISQNKQPKKRSYTKLMDNEKDDIINKINDISHKNNYLTNTTNRNMRKRLVSF